MLLCAPILDQAFLEVFSKPLPSCVVNSLSPIFSVKITALQKIGCCIFLGCFYTEKVVFYTKCPPLWKISIFCQKYDYFWQKYKYLAFGYIFPFGTFQNNHKFCQRGKKSLYQALLSQDFLVSGTFSWYKEYLYQEPCTGLFSRNRGK